MQLPPATNPLVAWGLRRAGAVGGRGLASFSAPARIPERMVSPKVSTLEAERFCNLSPAETAPTMNCAAVHDACFDGEQIILHGPEAARHKQAIDAKLSQTKDVYDVKANLRPWEHRTTMVADPGATYQYLPLAVQARIGAAQKQKNDTSAYQVHRQPLAPSAWVEGVTALAFFPTFSNAWTETFARSLTQVFELWCAHRGRIVPIPAAWGTTCGVGSPCNEDDDYAGTYLGPLSAWHNDKIWPMSLTPRPETLAQAIYGNSRVAPGKASCDDAGNFIGKYNATGQEERSLANASCLAQYMRQANAFFESRGQRCFRDTTVCAFGGMPWHARPWSLMQALASAHGGPPPAGRNLTVHHLRACESEGSGEDGESSVEGGGCPLRVVFIQREGRRRLANLDEHVAVCNSWRPPARARGDGLKVRCRAHSFKQGLKANIPLLRKTDVLIGPHGTPAGLERCRPCLTTPFDLPARCPLLGLRPLQATQSMS